MDKSLGGITVLVTRPTHQANSLCDKIMALGGTTVLLPTIDIVAINQSTLKSVSKNIQDGDIVIYLSVNAVLHSQALTLPHSITTIAIGPSTAKALSNHNIQVNFTPQSYNSEGVLELDIFKNDAHKNVFIIGGEHPRPLLADVLTKNGATVHNITCYKRCLPNIDKNTILQLPLDDVDVIVSTSVESLTNLVTLLGATNKSDILNKPLLVISDRMNAAAIKMGLDKTTSENTTKHAVKIITAENATNDAIVECLTTRIRNYAAH